MNKLINENQNIQALQTKEGGLITGVGVRVYGNY